MNGIDISLKNVSVQFAKNFSPLSNLNLHIHAGEFVSIVGPSGCGKSTLLRVIAGLQVVTQGQRSLTPSGKISYVFQEAHLLPWRNISQNIALPFELTKAPVDSGVIHDVIQKVGLQGFEKYFPHQLSGGMKMRASLARALVNQPALLLLDEPFAALDEVTRFKLEEDLLKIWQTWGMTIVFVTHSLSEAVFLTQKVHLLSKHKRCIVSEKMINLSPRDENLRQLPTFSQTVRDLQHEFLRFSGDLS